MRVVIENSVNRQVMRIPEWFCEQEGIDYHTASIEAETDKAILLEFKDKQVWVPRSIISIYDAPKEFSEY